MRVISQDGTIDVPYEQVVIQCFNREIYFLNKNLTGVDSLIEDIKMASYSTEEKALKLWKCLEKCMKIMCFIIAQPVRSVLKKYRVF